MRLSPVTPHYDRMFLEWSLEGDDGWRTDGQEIPLHKIAPELEMKRVGLRGSFYGIRWLTSAEAAQIEYRFGPD